MWRHFNIMYKEQVRIDQPLWNNIINWKEPCQKKKKKKKKKKGRNINMLKKFKL